jgi:hypothetical protein
VEAIGSLGVGVMSLGPIDWRMATIRASSSAVRGMLIVTIVNRKGDRCFRSIIYDCVLFLLLLGF